MFRECLVFLLIVEVLESLCHNHPCVVQRGLLGKNVLTLYSTSFANVL